jgi:serine/threonine-protein kinase
VLRSLDLLLLCESTLALPATTEVLETLGEGSFGTVYVALLKEGALERTVVLKVLKPRWSAHPEILVRSRDEALVLARLNHDNIVKVEQLTDIDGRPAVVMEHVQGLTLDRVLKEQGPLPVSVAIAVAAKVAAALHAAYSQIPPGGKQPLRVVHRDIKPSNVIVSVSGGVKVLDFGTARANFNARGASTSAMTLGSPLYMAPECFDGAESDPTVDMYALGATVFEMVAGVPLGKLSVNPEKHAAQLERRLAQLQSPELKDPAVLKAVRNLIGRCMRYDPGRRPKAKDMRRLSQEFLKRLPRSAVTLDQFAQVTVEPLYRNRKVLPPIPLDATLDSSGLQKLGGSSSGRRSSGSRPAARSSGAKSARTSGAQARSSGARPAPAPIPPVEPEEKPGAARIALYAAVGVSLGVLLVAGLFLLVQGTTLKGPETPETPETEVPVQPAPEVPEPVVEPPPEAPPVEVEAAVDEPVEPAVEATPASEPERPVVERPVVERPVVERPVPAPVVEDEPAAPPVLVRVVSVPAGATVTLGGSSAVTPGSLTATPGPATAQVTFPDGSTGSCSVSVSEGGRLAFRSADGGVTCP